MPCVRREHLKCGEQRPTLQHTHPMGLAVVLPQLAGVEAILAKALGDKRRQLTSGQSHQQHLGIKGLLANI